MYLLFIFAFDFVLYVLIVVLVLSKFCIDVHLDAICQVTPSGAPDPDIGKPCTGLLCHRFGKPPGDIDEEEVELFDMVELSQLEQVMPGLGKELFSKELATYKVCCNICNLHVNSFYLCGCVCV